jgi:hypothetical protein
LTIFVLELVLNFAWMAVVVSLWGLWLVRRRDGRKRLLLCNIAAGAVPLAVMTAILLPAISITDDLHACQIPAEIRRSDVPGDRHIVPIAPAKDLPFAPAFLAFLTIPSGSRWPHFVVMEQLLPSAMHGCFRALFSRPPPAVA